MDGRTDGRAGGKEEEEEEDRFIVRFVWDTGARFYTQSSVLYIDDLCWSRVV